MDGWMHEEEVKDTVMHKLAIEQQQQWKKNTVCYSSVKPRLFASEQLICQTRDAHCVWML